MCAQGIRNLQFWRQLIGSHEKEQTPNYSLPLPASSSGKEVEEEGDAYDDVLQEVFLFLDDASLLQTRLVCKRWRSYTPRITSRLCEQAGIPPVQLFFHYCLCRGREGAYAHWFDEDMFDALFKGEYEKFTTLLPRFMHLLTKDLEALNRRINRYVTKERLPVLTKFIDECMEKFIPDANNGIAANFVLNSGNPYLLHYFWKGDNLPAKDAALTTVSKYGSLEVLYSLDVSYPEFHYEEHVPRDWIVHASERLATPLLTAAFNSNRLDVCELVLLKNPSLSFNVKMAGNCPSDHALQWLCEYGVFDLPEEEGGLDFLMGAGTTKRSLLECFCAIPDLHKETLELAHFGLNMEPFTADCLSSLIHNKRFDCLVYALACTQTYELSCFGEAKLLTHYNREYSPLQELEGCISKVNLPFLELLLEAYKESIDRSLLLTNLKKKKEVSPLAMMSVLKAEAARDGIDLGARW